VLDCWPSTSLCGTTITLAATRSVLLKTEGRANLPADYCFDVIASEISAGTPVGARWGDCRLLRRWARQDIKGCLDAG
jgi:hypothetical protein